MRRQLEHQSPHDESSTITRGGARSSGPAFQVNISVHYGVRHDAYRDRGKHYNNNNTKDDMDDENDDDSQAMDEYLQSRIDAVFSKSSDRQQQDLQRSASMDSSPCSEQKCATHTPPPTERTRTTAATTTATTTRTTAYSSLSSNLVYNPLSNYSPLRPARREIMGMSIFATNPSSYTLGRRLSHYKQLLDSEQALEKYAQQMRTEIRHTEMVELAIAAEQAADAGEERFAGKPSTYGADDVHLTPAVVVTPNNNNKNNDHDFLMRRHSSFSEGTKIITLRHAMPSYPYNKLRVLALRDVKDVFPNFAHFHRHLRTHLARSNMEENNLVFHEVGPQQRKLMLPSDLGCKNGQNFLEQLNFEHWVGTDHQGGQETTTASSNNNDLDDSERSDIGDLLASHEATPTLFNSRRPRIDIPDGLDAPSDTHIPIPARMSPVQVATTAATTKFRTQSRTGQTVPAITATTATTTSSSDPTNVSLRPKPAMAKWRNISSNTEETATTSSSSENEQQSEATLRIQAISPKALFDDEFDSDSENIRDGPKGSARARSSSNTTASLPTTPKTHHYSDPTSTTNTTATTLDAVDAMDAFTSGKREFVTPTRLREEDSSRAQLMWGAAGPVATAFAGRDDFVTPTRLRDIRRVSTRGESRLAPSSSTAAAGLLLPANSVLESSTTTTTARTNTTGTPTNADTTTTLLSQTHNPRETPVLEIREAITAADCKDSALMLPDYFMVDVDDAEVADGTAMGTGGNHRGTHPLAHRRRDMVAAQSSSSTNNLLYSPPINAFVVREGIDPDKPSTSNDSDGSMTNATMKVLSLANKETNNAATSEHSTRTTGPLSSIATMPASSSSSSSLPLKQSPVVFAQLHDQEDTNRKQIQELQATDPAFDGIVKPIPANHFGGEEAAAAKTTTTLSSSTDLVQSSTGLLRVTVNSAEISNSQVVPTSTATIIVAPETTEMDKERTNHSVEQVKQRQDVFRTKEPPQNDLCHPCHQECGCWQSFSPVSTVDETDDHVSDDASDRRTLRRSLSTGALGAEQEITFKRNASRRARKEQGNSFHVAMKMFSRLSPSSSLFKSHRRKLYVGAKENEDFLNNYMYCSKPPHTEEQLQREALCTEPCQDARNHCGEVDPTHCCVNLLGDAMAWVPRRPRTASSRHLFSKASSMSGSKLEVENWFDLATERFDVVLDQLVGGGSRQQDRWNVSFQAPVLKVHVGTDTAGAAIAETAEDTERLDGIDEKKDFDEDVSVYDKPGKVYFAVPQPLFTEPDHALSDEQFQLIYGVSRHDFQAQTSMGRRRQQQEQHFRGNPPTLTARTDGTIITNHHNKKDQRGTSNEIHVEMDDDVSEMELLNKTF